MFSNGLFWGGHGQKLKVCHHGAKSAWWALATWFITNFHMGCFLYAYWAKESVILESWCQPNSTPFFFLFYFSHIMAYIFDLSYIMKSSVFTTSWFLSLDLCHTIFRFHQHHDFIFGFIHTMIFNFSCIMILPLVSATSQFLSSASATLWFLSLVSATQWCLASITAIS